MRKPLAFAAIALTCLGAGGCSGSRRQIAHAPAARAGSSIAALSHTTDPNGLAVVQGPLDTDIDNPRAARYDGDDIPALHFGHAVDMTEARTVTALVMRYFRAAAAGDGAMACPLVFWLFVEGIAEQHNRAPRSTSQRTQACRALLPAVLKEYRGELAADAKLRVLSVRVKGNRGLVLLTFANTPERLMVVHRESGAWKVNEATATGFP